MLGALDDAVLHTPTQIDEVGAVDGYPNDQAAMIGGMYLGVDHGLAVEHVELDFGEAVPSLREQSEWKLTKG